MESEVGLPYLSRTDVSKSVLNRAEFMAASEADRQLVERIRAGEPDAWQQCIDLYEGRLLAFARTRLADRSAAEDIVQETLLGFLKALPNYDERTPLESWLFSIAAHKLIDFMRRSGRRPMLPLLTSESKDGAARDLTGPGRAASSMMRSSEKSRAESALIENCLRELIQSFKSDGAWERLQCVELIFVLGWANKDVAVRLNITEQAVANHKFFVVTKLKDAARLGKLSGSSLAALGLD
ncbi:MAG: RNA polymerase sigma factor [Planctomycetota bacterium]